MALVLRTFQTRLATTEGADYVARACGHQRDDGLWEGWIEFLPSDGSPVLRTGRETTQPNLPDLEYWTRGLTTVYLEGAFDRTLARMQRGSQPVDDTPAYGEPAPEAAAVHGRAPGAVLDPFSVYAKGEGLLRRQLHALSSWHLENIVRAHHLASEDDLDLEALSHAELVELIVAANRGRAA